MFGNTPNILPHPVTFTSLWADKQSAPRSDIIINLDTHNVEVKCAKNFPPDEVCTLISSVGISPQYIRLSAVLAIPGCFVRDKLLENDNIDIANIEQFSDYSSDLSPANMGHHYLNIKVGHSMVYFVADQGEHVVEILGKYVGQVDDLVDIQLIYRGEPIKPMVYFQLRQMDYRQAYTQIEDNLRYHLMMFRFGAWFGLAEGQ